MNDLAIIREKVENNTRYLFVDTSKMSFRNMKWTDLGDWGKRKADNFLVLSSMTGTREYVKPVYV